MTRTASDKAATLLVVLVFYLTFLPALVLGAVAGFHLASQIKTLTGSTFLAMAAFLFAVLLISGTGLLLAGLLPAVAKGVLNEVRGRHSGWSDVRGLGRHVLKRLPSLLVNLVAAPVVLAAGLASGSTLVLCAVAVGYALVFTILSHRGTAAEHQRAGCRTRQ